MMKDSPNRVPPRPAVGWRRYGRQLAWTAGLLVIGMVAMAVLASTKRPPAETGPAERPLPVEGVRLAAEDVSIALTGYGAVRPVRWVNIAAEVAGVVTEAHPLLRVGEVIPAGELLFAVDDRDYRAAVQEAAALAEQSRQTVRRLEEELRRNRERLDTVRRNRQLAAREFERVRQLFDQHQIGSQTELDAAEQAVNTSQDVVDQLEKSLAVAPLLINEAEAARDAAEARLDRAQRQLERCRVRAPFDARVVRSLVEEGQLVHAAADVLTLADDSMLEISVPLDAGQAQKWLRFRSEDGNAPTWIADVEPVPCRVRWTEEPETHQWTGVLDRVQEMSLETRTLKVVVRVARRQALNEHGFPLVEGMFCAVDIPGRMLHDVYRASRWLVGVDETVFLAVDGRLATRPVRIAHVQDDVALIDQGLQDGEILIVTRLGDPLEHSLLDLTLVDREAALP